MTLRDTPSADEDGIDRSEHFRLALEASPTGMLMIDRQGKVRFANAAVLKLLGYTKDELADRSIDDLVPARFRGHHASLRAGYLDAPATRAMGAGRDLYAVRKDGTEVPVEIGLNPFRTAQGDFVLSSIIDITDRKRAMRALEEQATTLGRNLREREALLQEVHHRVKNNLQIICSLINIHSMNSSGNAQLGLLLDCKARIEAIALIHERLYQARDYGRVEFSAYARMLTDSVVYAAGAPTNVTVEFDVDEVELPVDKAVPCGLILNELVTNALKHAFPQERAGRVRVVLKRTVGQVELAVEDDGAGLDSALLQKQRTSIGLDLVETLTEQLEGRLNIGVNTGTRVSVEFGLEPMSPKR